MTGKATIRQQWPDLVVETHRRRLHGCERSGPERAPQCERQRRRPLGYKTRHTRARLARLQIAISANPSLVSALGKPQIPAYLELLRCR